MMANQTCETCGNNYENCMTIQLGGETHTYDCFECAIQGLAPHCAHCGVRVIGHGIGAAGKVFCCDSCVRMEAKSA